jgi:predicted RND superfamily exporter protein
MDSINKESSDSMQGFQTAYDNWALLYMHELFISNAIQNIFFSILFSLIILIITTGNVYISFIAIFCITSIVLNLMGVISFLGWKFGMVESTCVIVFIGISIDYVVHICHQYVHSIYDDRK